MIQNSEPSILPGELTKPDATPIVAINPRKKFISRKFIVTLLGGLVLIGGLGVGIFLSQQEQDIRGRAEGGCEPGSTDPICVNERCLYLSGQDPNSPCTGSTSTTLCGVEFTRDCSDWTPPESGGGGLHNFCPSGTTLVNTPTQTPPINTGPVYCSWYFPSSFYAGDDQEPKAECSFNVICCPAGTNPANVTCDSTTDYWSTGKTCALTETIVEVSSDLERVKCRKCSCVPVASASPQPSPSPSPSPIAASCQSVNAYSASGNNTVPLTQAQLAQLEPGDQINLCVVGLATGGSFDLARFTINGIIQPERPITSAAPNQGCLLYTIPSPLPVSRQFDITAQVHHAVLGWFPP